MLDGLKQVFFEEANELITSLESLLVDLEKEGVKHDTLSGIFRVMHSLKGSSSMFGYLKLADLTHNMETVYDEVRNDNSLLSRQLIDITFDSIDVLKDLLLDEDKIPVQVLQKADAIISELQQFNKQQKKQQISNNSILQNEEENTFFVRFRPNANILKNGNNPLYLVDELSEMGDAVVIVRTDTLPNAQHINLDTTYLWWEIFISTTANSDDILGVFIFVEDESEIDIEQIANTNAFLDGSISKEEILSISKISSPFDLSLLSLKKDIAHRTDEFNYSIAQAENIKSEIASSIRVSTKKVDELVNLVSELVTAQDRFQLLSKRLNIPELSNLAEDMTKLSREIRNNAFSIILIPIDSILVKYKRLVRDLAAELGKEIELITIGGDTELDKKIIENLNEPLLHLIRNCADHGIESPEEREKIGKSRCGKITIRSYYSGSNINIQISDDGAGINLEKVRNRAFELGLISKNSNPTKNELLSFLFHSGFSTNNEVSELSGRGVGMDIVNKNISSIKGEVQISSVENKGTTFTIKLPLTLSIVDALLVTLDNAPYMIQIQSVDKIYKITSEELETSFNDIVIKEDQQIPYVNLREFFEIKDVKESELHLIVVDYEGEKLGLVVESVMGEYQGVLKDLGKFYKKVDVFSGGSILGDGRIALLIDTNKIMKKINKKEIKIQG